MWRYRSLYYDLSFMEKKEERVIEYHNRHCPEGIHYFEMQRGVIYHLNPYTLHISGIVSGEVYTGYKMGSLCLARQGLLLKHEFFKAQNP